MRALLVELGIVRDGLGAGTVRGVHGADVVRAQVRSEGIGVEGLVGDQDLSGQVADELWLVKISYTAACWWSGLPP